MGDIISNFKIENPDRPNKAIVYPFSFLLLLIFGYNNYRRKQEWLIMLKQIYRWFCYIGIHRYDIIDTKYGFGAAGSTETVKCKDCGITKIRQKNWINLELIFQLSRHVLKAIYQSQFC